MDQSEPFPESPQTNNNVAADKAVNIMSGLYWYKHVFSQGAKAAILSIQNGQISMETRDGVVFNAPVQSISSVEFKNVAYAMCLTVNGTTYILRPNAPYLTRGFSKEQLAKLNATRNPGTAVRTGVLGGVAGSVIQNVSATGTRQAAGAALEGAGAVLTAVGIIQGTILFKQWETVLANNGVVFKHNNYRGLNRYTIIIVAIIILLTIVQMILAFNKR